ncbi:MAG TPA: mechanosensitive ion channel protein MscS [Porphyromonadaceae bacterium]|nr:mechanosensitive ion channel protein MscS [Porphyromonadaceae bacterium]
MCAMSHNLIILQIPDNIEAAVQETIGIDKKELVHILDTLVDNLVLFGLKCLASLALFFIGRFLLRRLYNFIKKILEKKEVDKTIGGFFLSSTSVIGYITLVLMIVHLIGIEPTSVMALLASTGVGIGMALSGTLQNFAGGILILLTHPYRVEDLIETMGQFGIVKEIRLFHTVIETFDNRVILIPNGSISTGIINNYTGNDCRRISWDIPLCLGNDFEEAKEHILHVLREDKRILSDPPIRVFVSSFINDRVVISVWAWAKGIDYMDVQQEFATLFYKEYIQTGLKQTYPKMEVVLREKED